MSVIVRALEDYETEAMDRAKVISELVEKAFREGFQAGYDYCWNKFERKEVKK